MSRKTLARSKHIPQRMCIGCREALAKRALVLEVDGKVYLADTGSTNGVYGAARRSAARLLGKGRSCDLGRLGLR